MIVRPKTLNNNGAGRRVPPRIGLGSSSPIDLLGGVSGHAPVEGAKLRTTAPPWSGAKPFAPVLMPWLRMQSLNATRHAAALRPFRRDEFGKGAAAPTEAHIQAANNLVSQLRTHLLKMTGQFGQSVERAVQEPSTAHLQRALDYKELTHARVQAIEKIWDFYFEMFGQRLSLPYADWLLSCDRIALDCYQVAFLNVGVAKSIPTPPAFCYMRTGFSPSTFRRGIPLRRLGQQINPFPLIQLPVHRLVNPWTLGAVLHEVSHNTQNDLGLSRAVPKAIASRLLKAGVSPKVAMVWTRWNRETFADLSGLLLGGPQIVGSLLDVVARSPESTLHFNPFGVHPTPFLRGLINIELLRRMGFPEEAKQYRRAWHALYPDPSAGSLPTAMLKDFPEIIARVVDTICYQPYAELGNKSLAQVIPFGPKEQSMIEEAAGRFAANTDPGIIPARFLIGAARVALERKLARPGVIAENFYKELVRR